MINKLIEQTKIGVVKNFLTLFSGTIIAQFITLISIPLLSRFFSNIDHGLYGNYITILSYFSIVATLRYELAIVFAKSKKSVNYLIIICLINSLVVFFLSILVIILLKYYYFSNYEWSNISGIIFMLPLSIVFNGVIQTFINYYNRHKNYIELSKVRLFLSVLSNTLPFILSFIFIKKNVLIISYFIAQLIVATIILLHNYKLIAKIVCDFQPKLFKAVLVRFKKLAIYNSPSTLIDQLASTIPIIFIGYKFGVGASGVYLMATKVVSLPSAILTVPVSQIFFQQVSESHISGKSLKSIFKKSTLILLIISVFFFGLLFFRGEEIFKVILGNTWSESGRIASILAISGFIKFIVSPLSLILTATEKLKILALWQILSFISTLFLITLNWSNLQEYLNLLVVTDIIIYIIYFYIIYYNVK